jgi:hypothetical protein
MRAGEAPVVPEFAADSDAAISPSEELLRLRWSADGESVAALLGDELLGFMPAGHQRGFSKHLTASGAFGSVLDPDLFAGVFERAQA